MREREEERERGRERTRQGEGMLNSQEAAVAAVVAFSTTLPLFQLPIQR